MSDWSRWSRKIPYRGPHGVPYPLLRQSMEEMGIRTAGELQLKMGIKTYPATCIYGNMDSWLQNRQGKWRTIALQLSEFFQYSPEDLFAKEKRLFPYPVRVEYYGATPLYKIKMGDNQFYL